MSRSRSYSYTLNNYTDEQVAALKLLPCVYHVFGFESGASGTPHLQGAIYFSSQRSFASVKKSLFGAHLEVTRCLGASIQYCKKDGVFWEQGVAPIGAVGKKCTVSERAAKNKRLLEQPLQDLVATGELSLNQVPIIKKARIILAQEGAPVTTDDVRGLWLYGPPGTGKSHYARSNHPELYLKAQNKWWDGYTGQDSVLLDDFDCKELGHHLKIWADKWSCTGEIKGGTVNLKHKVFIITSNYHPDDLWEEDNMREAIKRRFKIVHFNDLKINKE